jgi:tRNA-2-methylthio-N6-dimethylallyladenosine synthase
LPETDKEKIFVPPSEIARQREYAELAKSVLGARFSGEPLAFVRTYGCQGNVSDGERIKGMLRQMGFGFTDEPGNADFVIYNTCAVREHAEDRVFGNVGALKPLKLKRKHMKIALCGCMMQQERVVERIKKSFPFVDMVIGTHTEHMLPEYVYRLYQSGKKVFETPDSPGVIAEGLPVERDSAFKAWIPIMYGCDNFCSYCIVPYVRGRERSRSLNAVLDEAREAVAAGCREITLLGQNVNSYVGGGGVNFSRLLREINAIDGDFIIRFMTSNPKDCTSELLDTMAQCEKAAKHLHLPFQSGSDRILNEMNRRYTRERYLDLVRYARRVMPGLSITSDVIVGFPGESYDDFQETMSLADEVKFSSLFMFVFSPREGTAASKLPDAVDRGEKIKWFQELERMQAKNSEETAASMVGKTFRVLCDTDCRNGLLSGRTEGGMTVTFEGEADMVGKFANIRIDTNSAWSLKGSAVK